MNDRPAHRSAGAAPAPPGPEAGCLGELARALAEQLEGARHGDLDRVIELAREVDSLIEKARALGARPDGDLYRHVLRLHDQVRLTLAQKRDEVAQERARLRRGRLGLHAYDRTAAG